MENQKLENRCPVCGQYLHLVYEELDPTSAEDAVMYAPCIVCLDCDEQFEPSEMATIENYYEDIYDY